MDEGSVGNVFDGAWKWAYGSVDLWELIVVYTCICGRTPLNGPPVLPLLKLKWLLPIHTSWGRGEHTPPVWQDHCLLRSMTHGFNCQSVGEAPLNLLTLPSFPFTATGHGLIECMWNAGLYNYAKLAYIMKGIVCDKWWYDYCGGVERWVWEHNGFFLGRVWQEREESEANCSISLHTEKSYS